MELRKRNSNTLPMAYPTITVRGREKLQWVPRPIEPLKKKKDGGGEKEEGEVARVLC